MNRVKSDTAKTITAIARIAALECNDVDGLNAKSTKINITYCTLKNFKIRKFDRFMNSNP